VQDDRSYWLRRQRDLPELQAVGYRSRSAAFNEWIYRVRARITRDAIAWLVARLRPPVRVLDVGSGTGFYVSLWEERPELGELLGVDLSPDAVARLRDRYPAQRFEVVEVGSGKAISLGSTFDVVECFDVLYHLTDDGRFEAALRELATLVRPGGFLVITDNFPARDVTTRPHVRLRSADTYRRILLGFEEVYRVPQFLLLNVPSGIVRSWIRWPLVALWEAATWPARWQWGGAVQGRILAAADRRLLRLTGGRTPSTELAIFRREKRDA
jgi:SAM-dependent methyltransferase